MTIQLRDCALAADRACDAMEGYLRQRKMRESSQSRLRDFVHNTFAFTCKSNGIDWTKYIGVAMASVYPDSAA